MKKTTTSFLIGVGVVVASTAAAAENIIYTGDGYGLKNQPQGLTAADDYLYPGSGSGLVASDNTVTINYAPTAPGVKSPGKVLGGYAHSSAAGHAIASGNTVLMKNGRASEIYGGSAKSNNAASTHYNIVTINSGSVSGNIDGGNSQSVGGGVAMASNNIVIINGGSVGNIRGGYTNSTGTVKSDNNIVTINDGTVNGSIYGGYTFSPGGAATATDNIVTIGARARLFASTTEVWGGYVGGGGDKGRVHRQHAEHCGSAYG